MEIITNFWVIPSQKFYIVKRTKIKMINLDKWQREVLDHKGDLLLCTGRRVGKTYILARKAIDLMAKKPNTPIIMISLTEDQAMIIMSMALNYAREKYPRLIGKGKNKPTMKSMHVNGGKMIVRPVGNTGDGARGFEGGVLIVDEASRMPKRFWIAAKPIILTTGGEIWMGSTPHGKQGYFWEKFDEAYNKKDPNSRFKVFYTWTQKVLEERLISESWTLKQREESLRILEVDKREMSELEFGQEYMGLFLDDMRQFFEDDLIERCCVLERDSITSGKNYLGVDIARMGDDESTFEVITDQGDDRYVHRENQTTKKTLTPETEKNIMHYAEIWDARKIGIDAGAGTLGVSILDHLLQTKWRNKVLALNNRALSMDVDGKEFQRLLKEDMYHNLKSMMEHGELKLLKDRNVMDSLKSVQYEYSTSPSGKTTFKIFGRYTHIAEGLIRAAWLAKKEKTLNLFVTYSNDGFSGNLYEHYEKSRSWRTIQNGAIG